MRRAVLAEVAVDALACVPFESDPGTLRRQRIVPFKLTRIAVVCVLAKVRLALGDAKRALGNDLVEGECGPGEDLARVAVATSHAACKLHCQQKGREDGRTKGCGPAAPSPAWPSTRCFHSGTSRCKTMT